MEQSAIDPDMKASNYKRRRMIVLAGLAVALIIGIVCGVVVLTTQNRQHEKSSDSTKKKELDAVAQSTTSVPTTSSLRPASTLPTLPPVSDPINEPTETPTKENPKDELVWVMEETFDGDPHAPSQELLPRNFEYVVTHRTHPKEHFTKLLGPYPADHDANCTGPDPNAPALPQHAVYSSQNTSSSRPDASFYVCKNHMMSSMGDVIGYSVSAFWPRQEFVVAGTTTNSVLEFDVNLNDGHTVRSWWEILIAPRDQLKVGAGPVDSPISETYPRDRIVLDFRRNARGVRIGTAALAPDGWLVDEKQFGPYDYAYWRSLHPTDPANDDRRIRRKMRIEFDSNNNTLTWGIQTEDGTLDEWSIPLPAPLPFESGLVLFKTHAYTPEKDGNLDAYTFHWDNIRFTGPVRGQYHTYEASNVVYLQRNGNRTIGDTATVVIDLPDNNSTKIQNPVLFGQVHHPIRGQVLLSINGGTNIVVHPYEYETDDCFAVDWKSFRLPLDASVLVQGSNTFQWTVGPRPNCLVDDFEWNGFSVKFLQLQTSL